MKTIQAAARGTRAREQCDFRTFVLKYGFIKRSIVFVRPLPTFPWFDLYSRLDSRERSSLAQSVEVCVCRKRKSTP